MRTTLDIEEEVLNVVEDFARRQRRWAGVVISGQARQKEGI